MSRLSTNPDDLRLLVGKKLKQARLDKGLSQKELAELMGITRIVVSSYERGRLRITVQFLLKVCKILDKPIYYFVEEDEEVKQKYELELRRNTSFYDLADNLQFSLEMSIRSYLKARGISEDINEKIDRIMTHINNTLLLKEQ